MTQSAHSGGLLRVRIGGVETCRYCNNHRNVWVRWDVALCSRCCCEIRQGQFHIFTLLTAAGKFYSCCRVWLLLMCQKWIPLGKIHIQLRLYFLLCLASSQNSALYIGKAFLNSSWWQQHKRKSDKVTSVWNVSLLNNHTVCDDVKLPENKINIS